MKNISTASKKNLTDRESRLLYCSLDSAITSDIWKTMTRSVNSSAQSKRNKES